ncbi:hypothetical protein HDV57DRAFT_495478, partial [Trichoderma longibrachiatum]
MYARGQPATLLILRTFLACACLHVPYHGALLLVAATEVLDPDLNRPASGRYALPPAHGGLCARGACMVLDTMTSTYDFLRVVI